MINIKTFRKNGMMPHKKVQ